MNTQPSIWASRLAVSSAILLGASSGFAQTVDIVRQVEPQARTPEVHATPEELGDALMMRQRYEAAIGAYQQADPVSANVWNKMGIASQLMFNQQEALRCYRESILLDPKNSNAFNNLGTLYDSMKRYRDAEKMFKTATDIDPHFALAYKNLGTSLISQHEYDKGWAAYQKAIALDPKVFRNQAPIHVENPGTAQDRGAMNYLMAKGCVRAGMNDCAIDHLRRALNEGFTNAKKIDADSEFAGLRGLPAFNQLLASQGP